MTDPIYELATPSSEPLWLHRAMESRGCRTLDDDIDLERVPRHILWLPALTALWGDCETPESGRMVMRAIRRAGLEYPRRWWTWKGWQAWGCPLTAPHVGAVAIVHRYFDRCGIVGIVAGARDDGKLLVLTYIPPEFRPTDSKDRAYDLVPVAREKAVHLQWPVERMAQLAQYRLRDV